MVAAVGRDQFAALGLVRVLPVVKPLFQGLRDGFALADFVLFEIGCGRRQPSFRYDKRRLLSAAALNVLNRFLFSIDTNGAEQRAAIDFFLIFDIISKKQYSC